MKREVTAGGNRCQWDLTGPLHGHGRSAGVVKAAERQLAGSLAIGAVEVDRSRLHIADRRQFDAPRTMQAKIKAAWSATFGDHSLRDRERTGFQLANFAEGVLH